MMIRRMAAWPSICYDALPASLSSAWSGRGRDDHGAGSLHLSDGRAHWHVLPRARAIETGCFVVAAAQCGTHADGRRTYGHAVIISPWGKVVAEVPTDDDAAAAGANDGIALATLDREMVAKARDAIPSLTTNPEFSRES